MEIGGVNPNKFGEIIVELMDDLTINFYAPNDMSIDTIDNILKLNYYKIIKSINYTISTNKKMS